MGEETVNEVWFHAGQICVPHSDIYPNLGVPLLKFEKFCILKMHNIHWLMCLMYIFRHLNILNTYYFSLNFGFQVFTKYGYPPPPGLAKPGHPQ